MTHNTIENDVPFEVVHRIFTKAFGLAKLHKV